MIAASLALLFAAAPPIGTEVSPLVVYPTTSAPKLVASYPAEGAAARPGVVVMKLTFDQEMAPNGFDLASVAPADAAGAETPPCLKVPRLLNDAKTFVLLCTLRAGRSYAVALNSGPAEGFMNIGDRRATPHILRFTTNREESVRSLDEAMKRQGLTALEAPILETPELNARGR